MDFAQPVEVAKIRSRPLDEVRPGGLGVHLMRSVMDHVEFLPPPAGIGNLLQMVKRIDAP
jgi:sigma-B regulation protein RsbU (phosphoserine phosphatase)